MSKATEALNLRGIHNPHNLCSAFGGTVYADYRPRAPRMVTPPGYRVIGVRGQMFGTAWYDHGARVFLLPFSGSLKERRARALAEALAFAAAQVSDKPTLWGRDPFGGWQTVDVLKRAGVKAKDVREVTPLPDTDTDRSESDGE